MRRSAGFSLVELMIAVALTAVVVLFLMQTFTTQQRSYVVLDQTMEVQQNSRAISDLLEHDARQAGMLAPRGAAACGTDKTDGPDTLYLADADVIKAGPPVGSGGYVTPSYFAVVLMGFGGSGSQTLTVDKVAPDGDPSVDTNNDGTLDSDFRVNGGAILVDANDPNRGSACGVVTSVTPPSTIVVKFEGGLTIPPGDKIALVPAHAYTVNNQNQLLRDGIVLANDVEDLQVAYFYDVNQNNVVDAAAAEYPGSTGSGVPVYQPDGWARDNLREVRVNVVIRTRAEVPGDTNGLFQNMENRAAVATVDGFRRRVFTSTVKLRNSSYETPSYPD